MTQKIRVLTGLAVLLLAALAIVPSSARAADTLIGHWISGPANLTDSSGFTPTGTHDGMAVGANAGSLTWSSDLPEPGFTGQSLDLTANNVGVLITNSAVTDGNYQTTFDAGISNRFSVAFWIKQSGTLGGDYISKSGNNGKGWRARMLSVGGQPASNRYADFTMRSTPAQTDVVPGLGSGNAIEATNVVNDGAWHHVVEVFDGTVAYRKIYVDGVLHRQVASVPYLVSYGGITNHLMLGANQDNLGSAPGGFFPGLLFDARVYNYPISDGEVQYLVTAGLSSSSQMFTFNFPGLGAATINGTNITITVPFTTDITALSPTYLCSALGTGSPASGTTRNFTSPQTYTVVSGDQTLTNTYLVTVTKSTPSSACDILSVNWGAYSSVILGTNVSLLVPAGTAVTALNPTVTVSPFASVSPASGSINDFTSPVNYTVTAEDGVTKKTYAVTAVPQYAWTNALGGNWSTGGNWDPNSAPASASTTALVFNTGGTYSTTNDLGDGFQLNLLSFGAPTVTLNGNSLQFVGTTPQVLNSSVNSVVVSNGLDLSVDTAVSAVGGLTFYGVISGTGALVKNGAGTLTLANTATDNTYSGGTVVNAGFLALAARKSSLFGTGSVTVNSPAQLNLNGNDNMMNAFTLNGVVVQNGNGFSAVLNGPVTLAATSTFDQGTTGGMAIGGNISGPGGLTKIGTGNGPMVLSGTNTYTGPTTINAGSIRYNKPEAVAGGALNIASVATVNLNFTNYCSATSLSIGGTNMPNGVYGSATSGADTTNAVFLGAGLLLVGPHNQALIKSFAFPGQSVPTIDQTNHTISLTVAYSTDVTALAPTYTVSPYASGSPASGTALDFTTPQTYTVISGDGTVTNNYTVTVTQVPPSSAKDILAFGPGAVITGTNISWPVSLAADLTTLMPTYTVSDFATGTPASGTQLDFTSPQTYTITAQDSSTKTYLVTAVPTSGIVLNGSFESPSLGAGNFQNNPADSGWTYDPVWYSGIAANGSPWFTPAAPDGVQAAFIQGSVGTETLSQTIGFNAGTYAVNFSVVGRDGYGSYDLSVQIDGQTVYSLTAAQISTTSWAAYTSTNFTVTSGSHTLAFVTGAAGGDADAIDNVSITTISTASAPTVSGITGPVAGQFTISGSANVAGNIVVLKTTSLTPPITWTPIQTNAVSAGAFNISIPQGADPSAFYQLMGQ